MVRILLSFVRWIMEAITQACGATMVCIRPAFRPRLEVLEVRNAPAVFTVSVSTDSVPAPENSLRAAVNGLMDPGNTDASNSIVFSSGLGAATIPLAAKLPVISKSVDILGPLAVGGLTITRAENAANFRIFTFAGGGDPVRIALAGLIISGGVVSGDEGGAGIFAGSLERFSLDHCRIVGNTAYGDGGGLAAFAVGNISITNSRFANNQSEGSAAHAGHGGAVAAFSFRTSTITVGNSFFYQNGAAIDGGAIYADWQGAVTITDSTFRDNGACAGSGGAILATVVAGAALQLNVTSTTFSANTATEVGGAIAAVPARVRGTIANCTINGNTAESGAAVYGNGLRFVDDTISNNTALDKGGALFVDPGLDNYVEILNCIIAGNTAVNDGPDVYGIVNSLGHNLLGDDSDSTGWVGSDILNEDPKLNELAYRGGTTMVMTLQSDSPAIDAGDDEEAAEFDERGEDRIVGDHIDIGAVEMQAGEESLSSPYAYDMDFSVVIGNTLNIDGDDDTPTLIDFSGNSGNEDVEIYAVNGEHADINTEVPTTEGGTVTLNDDGTFVYTAPVDFVGYDSFTYTAYDSDAEDYRTGTVTIHVTDIILFDGEFSMLKNQYLTVSADPQGLLNLASAGSGEAVTVTKVNGSSGNMDTNLSLAHGTLHVYATGAFTFDPTTDYVGAQTFTFTVDDGFQEVTATVTIHVAVLLAGDAEFMVVHDHTLTVPDMANLQDLLDFADDADSNTLTIAAINGDDGAIGYPVDTAMGGTVTVAADGTFVYDPPTLFAGDDWFSFTVFNETDYSTATAIIHVSNFAPTAGTPAYEIFANATLTAPAMMVQDLLYYGYDMDGDTLTVVAVNDDPDALDTEVETLHGHVTVQADGSFVYVPDTDWTGYDEFTIVLSDGIDTVIMTVTIHVV